MNLLLLGRGKTGSLTEELARQRGHEVQVLTSQQNPHASALTPDHLRAVDVVIDFTTPQAVLENMQACIRNRTPIVVGTTGWYQHLSEIEHQVRSANAALLYGSNFSIERHHAHKKDAPSGTAVSIQGIVAQVSDVKPEITSVREGDTVGSHVLLLDGEHDTMMLVHDGKSRRGFAEGAVRAAEWLKGKNGVFEFRKIFRELLK